MSTLTVTNIKATGETASRAVSGVAAAWINLEQVGTISIFDSLNVSGIIDSATGLTDIGLSSSMSNTGFALSITRQDTVVNNDSTGFDGISQKTVSNIRLVSIENAVLSDSNNAHCIAHGDLA